MNLKKNNNNGNGDSNDNDKRNKDAKNSQWDSTDEREKSRFVRYSIELFSNISKLNLSFFLSFGCSEDEVVIDK